MTERTVELAAADPARAVAAWAGAVALVTVADGRDDIGATISAFCPVSAEPALMLVSLMSGSYPAELFGREDKPVTRFAVTLLAAGQRMLAGRFAAAGRPGARHMLDDVPHRRGPDSGALIVDGGLAALECAVQQITPAGDHLLVIARVTGVPYVADSGQPLIRFRHRYVAIGSGGPAPIEALCPTWAPASRTLPASMTTGWAGRTTSPPTGNSVTRPLQAYPNLVHSVRANRAFLARTVRFLTGEAGIRQFLDIGTGIPTANNTHEVAQRMLGRSGCSATAEGGRATLYVQRARGEETPMMTGPGDGKAAGVAGHGRLLVWRGDREQVIDVLKAAFVQERLTKDEFDLRVGRALASRTYADLAALTADIPAGRTETQPLPELARKPDGILPPKARGRATAAGAGTGMLFTATLATVDGAPPVIGLVGVVLTGVVVAGLLAALLTFLSWAVTVSRQHSQGSPPGTGAQASADPAPDGPPYPPHRPSGRRGPIEYAIGRASLRWARAASAHEHTLCGHVTFATPSAG